MSADRRFFVDTNLLLYAVDGSNPSKRQAAGIWLNALWESGAGRISWQVLHEFYVNATRKMGMEKRAARDRVELLTLWAPIDSSEGLVRRAWEWTDTANISYWDALIVAAAERGGCSVLLTEDLQVGAKFGDLLVANPFLRGPGEFGLGTSGGTSASS